MALTPMPPAAVTAIGSRQYRLDSRMAPAPPSAVNARLVDAWPTLPDPIRRAMLELIGAQTGSGESR